MLRLAPIVALTALSSAGAQIPEALWYTRGEASTVAFLAHADKISAVSPQAITLDRDGVLKGAMDPRLVAAARARGVKLIPLVMNPGFDQPSIHRVLTVPEVRKKAIRAMAALCRDQKLDGIQFDIENVHVSDKDAFTSFSRETADSLHKAGCTLSAAVVPRASDDPGTNSYDKWIYDNWRGVYDYKALADAMDFISYMTYAQHTGNSTVGPVAGYPWMEACLRYVLSKGVPPEKISLGIAGYSDWWEPAFTDKDGPRMRGHDVSYPRAESLAVRGGAVIRWDDEQKSPHAMWEVQGVMRHAWMEDARAFHAKLGLVTQYKLRGYSVWKLGDEDPRTWESVPLARP